MEIEALGDKHDLRHFRCGRNSLDVFLSKHAPSNQRKDSSRTFVACDGGAVVGYYALTVGSIVHEDCTASVIEDMPRYPIPVVILARLAVKLDYQSRGVGRGLLKDAFSRTMRIADSAGTRALLVHAADQKAKDWYLKFDFEPSPTNPLHLFLTMRDIRASM